MRNALICQKIGAGSGNRTRAKSLGSSCDTISPYPRWHADSIADAPAARANRTRRALIARLASGPAKVTDLAKPFGLSLNGVSKHLQVLERAGLIERSIKGRTHSCALKAGPMASAEEWLSAYEAFWSGRLDAFAAFVENEPGPET